MDGAATLQMPPVDTQFIDRFLASNADESEERELAACDREVVACTHLAIQQGLAPAAQATRLNTPSTAFLPYAKPAPKPSGRGRKRGE